MMVKVGQKVRFLNEAGEGKVLSVNKLSALVETADGFEMEYPFNQLVPAASVDDFVIDDVEVERELKSTSHKKMADELDKKFNHLRTKKSDVLEIDLHIENLIDSHRGMQNYQILEVQMANFRRSLNTAISRKLKKMVVIHGVGEGVLKQEIRKELKEFYPHFDFYDASYQEYGYGATEIELKYKH